MIKRLVGQFNIIGKAVLGSLAPSLYRLAFVLFGLLLGLVWAYSFDPIKFKDAEPVHLADGYKDQWIKMAAVEYASSADTEEAKQKIVKAGVSPDMIQDLINDNQATDPQLAGQLQALLQVANDNESQANKQADKVESGFIGTVLGPVACFFGAAIIGILLALVFTFYFTLPIGKWARPKAGQVAAGGGQVGVGGTQKAAAEQKTDFKAAGEVPPVSQHMSIYILGNDLYDDSFAIETPEGAFLGECGSGISETIGVGSPKKVTAAEVWLFDKNDIRTVTKVLMSEHAFKDQALRSKLAPKGDAVMVAPAMVTTLETQTLRVQIRVVDLQYGEGSLPPNSFFERLTVEIAAWPKEDVSGTGKSQPPDTSAAFGDTAELLNY
ncbi:MAG: hypothetical protein HY866_09370 [Chloroflexi bacterium]|nr:hypothetical protein [Chloroflexota bacterium]